MCTISFIFSSWKKQTNKQTKSNTSIYIVLKEHYSIYSAEVEAHKRPEIIFEISYV